MFSKHGLAGLGLLIFGLYWNGLMGVIYIGMALIILMIALKTIITVLKGVLVVGEACQGYYQRREQRVLEEEARRRAEDAHMIAVAAVMEAVNPAEPAQLVDRGDGVYAPKG